MADRIAYNGADKWKQKATELLNQGGGGGGGNVDDVKVNGVSVVTNKVAEIDLTSYTTFHDVESELSDYYTKTEVDATLTNYYTKANTYSQAQVDSLLGAKANASAVYTKTESDTLLSAKADSTDVYSKLETYSDSEVDNLLSAKANSADLATVATSGSYNDLTDKPSIVGQIQSDWSQSDSTAVDYIKNKPTPLSAGEGIDITNSVISLEYLTVVNGKVCIVYDDGQ